MTRKTATAPELAARPRPARIVYSWVIVKTPKAKAKRAGVPHIRVECVWSLKGGNGEHMAGSWPEAYRDATDAKRAFDRVMELGIGHNDRYGNRLAASGPGPRPKDDEEVAL